MEKKKFNRRDFLTSLSLATGYLMFSNPLTATTSSRSSTDPFQLVKLGRSGLETTLIGMGTGIYASSRSSFLTRQGKDKSVLLIRHAYDSGLRFFDCADTYGTHPIMAETLKSIPREEITLTTKIWAREDDGIPEPERPDANVVIDRFRQELNTDYLDLVQLHCMVDGNWTEGLKRQMDILEDLKSKGIIRAHGVSVHTLEAMKAALVSPWVDVIHVRINPYGIAMDKPEPGEVVSVIHQLHNSGKGVIGMKLVGNGDFRDDSDKIDNSLRFVLGLGSVDMIIVGFQDQAEIDNYSQRVINALTQIRES